MMTHLAWFDSPSGLAAASRGKFCNHVFFSVFLIRVAQFMMLKGAHVFFCVEINSSLLLGRNEGTP